MLQGVRSYERIIVGAYVDERGGVCPMLAAHRCGRAHRLPLLRQVVGPLRPCGRGASAPATEREVRILITQLQESLSSAHGMELDRAIAEHHELVSSSRRAPRRRWRDTADPSGEIRARRLGLRSTREPLGETQAPRTRGLGRRSPLRARPARLYG